jgi:hypothetical protein
MARDPSTLLGAVFERGSGNLNSLIAFENSLLSDLGNSLENACNVAGFSYENRSQRA